MAKSSITTRMDAVERLTTLFKLERQVHLVVTGLSLVMLLTSTGVLIWRGAAGPAELGAMFGSSGLITYSASRLLFMWNQALRLLAGDDLEER
ncbi:MAG: hypothetical protein U0P30_13910 [Vicinamibacterales bacterium]